MATIQASIQLKDGMSPALRAIEKTLTNVVATFDRLETVLNRSLGTGKIDAANRQLGTTQQKVNKIEQEVNQAAAAERRFQSEVTKTLGAIYKQQTNQVRLTAAIRKTPPVIQQVAVAQEKVNNNIRKGATLMNGLVGKVTALAGAYMGVQSVKGIIGTADELTMTTARLNLMNDGLQTTAELEDKIYQAAMRSHGGFTEMADAVAKLGQRAGAIFKNNDETIAFTETLNKMFVIAGASQAEMASATLQLTQALGSGVLRGEEFNAVFEAAPNVMQAVADYIGKPIGSLKQLASEGKISASIVKNALFAASDSVNKQFEQMPTTWAGVWTLIKNYTIKATRPILQAISNITRSERFIRFMNAAGNAISRISGFFRNLGQVVSPILGWIYDRVAGIFNFISNNWSLLRPIVLGIAAAFLVMKAPLMAIAIWTGVCTVATKLWTAAQAVFNAVMAANPVVWVVLAVIALVAVFYLAIAAVNKMTGSTLSATGMIAGAFTWLYALLQNIIIGIGNGIVGLYNITIGVAQWCVEAWSWAGDNMGAIFNNIGVWWDNLWIDAQIGLSNFISWAMSKLASFAEWISPLADVLDIDLSGITKSANAAKAKSSALAASKKSYKALTSFNPNVNWKTEEYFKFKDLGEAYDKGYNWGSGLSEKVENFFSGLNYEKLTGDALSKALSSGLDEYGNPTTGGDSLNDIGKALSGALGDNPALDEIAKNIGDIAKDTGNISGKLNVSDEELNYVRKLAQRETINKYTRSQVNLHMTNNNQIRNGMDVKEVSRAIARQIQNEISYSAEGIRL